MDAFISHSSADAALAGRVERALERDGQTAWLDKTEIRVGSLLRDELQSSIEGSRAVILLWSKAAARSRWVAAEVLTAFHLGRFIIPCVLDAARLPQFLESTVYLDFRRNPRAQIKTLLRAVREAPREANELLPVMSAQSPELRELCDEVARGQAHELDLYGRWDTAGARAAHALVDKLLRPAERRWKFDALVLKLAGYHRKNAYLLKHADAINAGRMPKDPLLLRSERFFFETLFVNPLDYESLNGLASVLILERELDAALFFVNRAIELAARAGIRYREAEQDRALIRRYKDAPRAS